MSAINCWKKQISQGQIPKVIPHNITSQEKTWFQNFIELESIRPLLSQEFEEIIFHGPESIWIYDSIGTTQRQMQIDFDHWQLICEIISIKGKVSWNYTTSFQSFFITLFDQKLRVTLKHHSLGGDSYSKMFIRKIARNTHRLIDFTTKDELKILEELYQQKKNIVIAGSTGSGKTSLISSLLCHNQKNKREHIVVLEDTEEIQRDHLSMTHFLSKGQNGHDLHHFCEYLLRVRPDRIILGEIRGKEILPLILSLNTGHKGLLTTLHADSAQESIHRLATLFQLYAPMQTSYEITLQLITKSIDYVVYLNKKKVVEIIKVINSEKNHVFFQRI